LPESTGENNSNFIVPVKMKTQNRKKSTAKTL